MHTPSRHSRSTAPITTPASAAHGSPPAMECTREGCENIAMRARTCNMRACCVGRSSLSLSLSLSRFLFLSLRRADDAVTCTCGETRANKTDALQGGIEIALNLFTDQQNRACRILCGERCTSTTCDSTASAVAARSRTSYASAQHTQVYITRRMRASNTLLLARANLCTHARPLPYSTASPRY